MSHRLLELTGTFLRLGTISFGGPAAHAALIEQETVERRGWLTHQEFLDLLAVTQLIPGPNAVEMACQVGYRRAGFRGSIVAGVAFTAPAVAITAAFAVAYVRYGTLPAVEPFLAGIKPVIVAVIFTAVWRLAKKTLGSWQQGAVAVTVGVAAAFGADEVLSLLAGGVIGTLLLARNTPPATTGAAVLATGSLSAAQVAAGATVAAASGGAAAGSVSLTKLALFFLKVGAVLYGSGYVLVAYLEGGLVDQYHWLTRRELLDAVAVGQFTPGPVLTTATFVGYLLAGTSGAFVATAAIMFPAFLLVAAINPWIPRLRESRWASRFLDAVSAASLGLMAAVVVSLGQAAVTDFRSWSLALAAAIAGLRWQVNPAWLIVAGALAGPLVY